MTLEGGCCCSAIRYRLTNGPLIVHACHCRDCQRITGSAFVTNLWIERKHVERTGPEPKSYVHPGGSGRENAIEFCGTCGTTLWSDYRIVRTPCLFVRAGTLDDPSWVVPDVHIFTRSKLSWVKIPDGAPAFATVYELGQVWPADKLARLRSNA